MSGIWQPHQMIGLESRLSIFRNGTIFTLLTDFALVLSFDGDDDGNDEIDSLFDHELVGIFSVCAWELKKSFSTSGLKSHASSCCLNDVISVRTDPSHDRIRRLSFSEPWQSHNVGRTLFGSHLTIFPLRIALQSICSVEHPLWET